MTVSTSSARHLLLRLTSEQGARLPNALLDVLRDEVVTCGWMRASGVLHDVQICTLDARSGALGPARRISGPVQLLVLDGSVGLENGDVACALRAVLSRETDLGLETISGEILDARIGALEVFVTALDEVNAARQADASGVSLLEPAGAATRVTAPRAAPAAPVAPVTPVTPAAAVAPPAPVAPVPAPVVHAPAPAAPVAAAPPQTLAPAIPDVRSSEPELGRAVPPKAGSLGSPAAMPPKPIRPVVVEDENAVYPDTGDIVEHFAFGRCEVLKSDGDRLHLRVGKDARMREIALEMLKVTPLPPEEGQATRHFKLDRRL